MYIDRLRNRGIAVILIFMITTFVGCDVNATNDMHNNLIHIDQSYSEARSKMDINEQKIDERLLEMLKQMIETEIAIEDVLNEYSWTDLNGIYQILIYNTTDRYFMSIDTNGHKISSNLNYPFMRLTIVSEKSDFVLINPTAIDIDQYLVMD